MNAQDFLKAAADPDAWIRKSITLRKSANMLWDCFVRSFLQYAKAYRTKGYRGAEAAWEEADGYLTVAKMLYGLALETVFKAFLLRHRPGEIEFRLTADGANNLRSAEITRFGVSMGEGHDLVTLAEKAGAFRGDEEAVFSVESDRKALREVLTHLSECVLWRSRYPIPKRSGPEHRPPPKMHPKLFEHYIRDLLDPVLDHFQSKIDPSFAREDTTRRMFEIMQEEIEKSEGP